VAKAITLTRAVGRIGINQGRIQERRDKVEESITNLIGSGGESGFAEKKQVEVVNWVATSGLTITQE